MIYENITREEYVKLEGINASSLKPYYESVMNGNYEASLSRKESDAMRFGTMVHSLILEPEKFSNEYAIMPQSPINEKTGEPYGKTTKKYAEWYENLPKGKIYYSQDDFELIDRIQTNIDNNEPASKILKACPKRETAITWTDEATGIKCKALIDFMGDKIVGDLKTTRSIPIRDTEELTAKAIFWDLVSNRNLLQFSFYFDGCKANDLDVEKFAVIFAKNNGNCDIATAFLSDNSIEYGRDMYQRAMCNWIDKDENTGAFPSILEV